MTKEELVAAVAATSAGDCVGTTMCMVRDDSSNQQLAQSSSIAAVSTD